MIFALCLVALTTTISMGPGMVFSGGQRRAEFMNFAGTFFKILVTKYRGIWLFFGFSLIQCCSEQHEKAGKKDRLFVFWPAELYVILFACEESGE